MTKPVTNARPAAPLAPGEAEYAVTAVANGCGGQVGLADQTMTALTEGEEILGRLGAIVLARWWAGPGPVPVRRGWLSGRPRPHH